MNDVLWMGFTYSVSVRFLGKSEKDVDTPYPKSYEMPSYPAEAWRAAVSGETLLLVTVGEDGGVRESVVERESLPGFGSAAQAAVAKWKFYPGVLLRDAKKRVAAHVECLFVFHADEDMPRSNLLPNKAPDRTAPSVTAPAAQEPRH